MNAQKMNTLAENKRENEAGYYPSLSFHKNQMAAASDKLNSGDGDPRATHKQNVGFNLFQVLNKYIKVDQFLQGITDILRRVNNSEMGRNYQRQSNMDSPMRHGDKYIEQEQQVYEKQMRINARSPTRSGVISSPDPREQDVI